MRTLIEKYFGGLELQEDVYIVDLAALDRYQTFSGELLRLALLGIAGYGFLITNIVVKATSSNGLRVSPTTPQYGTSFPLGWRGDLAGICCKRIRASIFFNGLYYP